MKPPSGEFFEFDSLSSTQTKAFELIDEGQNPGTVFAHQQREGLGRRGKKWLSGQADSMTATFVFDQFANHSEPWLIGMSVALAAAELLEINVQWPNDLVWNKKKVGGILTHVHTSPSGQDYLVIGVGINLNQDSFPSEISDKATSMKLITNKGLNNKVVCIQLLDKIQHAPDPTSWLTIKRQWMMRDETPGKPYQLSDGEFITAEKIGDVGQLIGLKNGVPIEILAADAWFGELEQ